MFNSQHQILFMIMKVFHDYRSGPIKIFIFSSGFRSIRNNSSRFDSSSKPSFQKIVKICTCRPILGCSRWNIGFDSQILNNDYVNRLLMMKICAIRYNIWYYSQLHRSPAFRTEEIPQRKILWLFHWWNFFLLKSGPDD